MGPAAWLSVGKALGIALAASFFAKDGVAAALAREVRRAIVNNELEMARAMLRDLAWRHRESFRSFLETYGKDLPPEAMEEFRAYV